MSRTGYSDECDDYDNWAMICGRGAVASAIRGKRGQAFLREMLEALDALPQKSLIKDELQLNGEVCAMGAVALKRGIDVSNVDPEEPRAVAAKLQVSPALAREIAFQNDEGTWTWETPQQRWTRMRKWTEKQLAGRERGEKGT